MHQSSVINKIVLGFCFVVTVLTIEKTGILWWGVVNRLMLCQSGFTQPHIFPIFSARTVFMCLETEVKASIFLHTSQGTLKVFNLISPDFSPFSNVSANGLDGKRHSHIGCICLTFLHNELQTVWRCLWDKAFENTFENVQRRKVIQMQPMWLRLFSTKQFEDTFQNTQWRKCNSNLTILCLGRPLEGTLGKAQWTKV